MNISVRRLAENDGSGLEERPDYVALEAPRKVGYRDGMPLVPHPEGIDDGLELGDDPTEAYSHYESHRGDNLLLPESGDFLRRLADAPEVGGLDDVAKELNTDRRTVEKAAKLHGIDTPLESADDGESVSDTDSLTLVSGETVQLNPLHPLVLAQLLSDGLSTKEIAQYLSEETGEQVTETDVVAEAENARLLEDGRDDSTADLIPDSERTVTASDGEPANSPW